MKLLISPKNAEEAQEAIAGGADIIDVKNPKEGALGANFPWVIKEIRDLARGMEVSCAIGDAPNLPGSVSLSALGAVSLGVDYVKVGLFGVKNLTEAVFLVTQVTRAAKDCNPKVKVVASGYADASLIGAVDAALIPEVTHRAGADVAMLDTATKNGTSLFTYQTREQLEAFVKSAHSYGLQAALAGSLQKQDLAVLYGLGVDIAGFRGAVCTDSDRNNGGVTRQLVAELVEAAHKLKRA
ncbi:MAG: hypothetical protein NWE93_04300 [Candidatus Bathyarchaeota archaeon]|nr:hypothetical protein [Candidatus Bathyarchaeota archaeon]